MEPSLCLFTDSIKPSGVGGVMLALAAELRHTYSLSLVCPATKSGQALLDRAHALGIKVHGLAVRYPAAVYEFRKWLQSNRIEILHCHAGVGWEGILGIYAAREAGVPAVIRTEHLPYLITALSQRADYFKMLELVDRVTCVSHQVRESFVDAGASPDQFHTVHNGIHVPGGEPDRAGVRAELGLAPTAKLVLTVGRMAEQKGHTYLLEAAPEIIARKPDARFVWVGDGPLEYALRKRVIERGMANYFCFTGSYQNVPRLIASSDLLVLPSLFEGLPLIVLEGMALGTPVVGTLVCGTSEAIEDGVSGRLVEAGNPRALALAIVELLHNPERAAMFAAAAHERFQSHFHASRMAREMDAHYQEVLGGQALPTRIAMPSLVNSI